MDTSGDTRDASTAAERSFVVSLLRWLPAITASVAALAAIVVATISYSAARSATDKDYVALAMNVLSDKSSSLPSRRWAVDVLSKLSPVAIPHDLASGLITGRSVLPADLDPAATRASIAACFQPVLSSPVGKTVASASVPKGGATVGDWIAFGDAQTAQLDKANGRVDAMAKVIVICLRQEPRR